MKNAVDVLQAVVALGWLVLAIVLGRPLLSILRFRGADLTKLSVGPAGLSAEFVTSRLDEAARSASAPSPDPVSKSVVVQRLHEHGAVLARAHVLWVDDHPENNQSIVELLSGYGVDVEVARTNAQAISQLARHPWRFDVLISDMGRDAEPEAGQFPGVAFAEQALELTGTRTILFAGRFEPTAVPGLSPEESLALTRRVDSVTFGRTNRADELIHLVLDLLERSPRAARTSA